MLSAVQGPPPDKWERETADTDNAAKTWGLRDRVLRDLAARPTRAMIEIHSRLCLLYPDYHISYMPSDAIQGSRLPGAPQAPRGPKEEPVPPAAPREVGDEAARSDGAVPEGGWDEEGPGRGRQCGVGAREEEGEEDGAAVEDRSTTFDCSPLLANAPVAGDTYSWCAGPGGGLA